MTDLFYPYLKPQLEHYLWPATHLCLTYIKKSCLCLENSFHKMLLWNSFSYSTSQKHLLGLLPSCVSAGSGLFQVALPHAVFPHLYPFQILLQSLLSYPAIWMISHTAADIESQHGNSQHLQTMLKLSSPSGCEMFPEVSFSRSHWQISLQGKSSNRGRAHTPSRWGKYLSVIQYFWKHQLTSAEGIKIKKTKKENYLVGSHHETQTLETLFGFPAFWSRLPLAW